MSLGDLMTSRRPGAPLQDFGEALGIDAELWRRCETVEKVSTPVNLRLAWELTSVEPGAGVVCRLRAVHHLPGEGKAKSAVSGSGNDGSGAGAGSSGDSIDDLLSFHRSYAGAFSKLYLEFEEEVGEGYREKSEQLDLQSESEFERVVVEDFLKGKPNRKQVVLYFEIDKRELLKRAQSQLSLEGSDFLRPELFFFAETVVGLFAQPLTSLEALWSRDPPEKVVVLVPCWGGFLDGRYLAVVGGDPRDRWKQMVEVPEKEEKEGEGKEHEVGWILPQQVAKARRRNLRWQTEWIRRLTPLHLEVAGDTPPADPIARTLRIRLANLSILFTADWTELAEQEQPLSASGEREDDRDVEEELEGLQDDEMVGTYAGVRQKVKLPLADPCAEPDVLEDELERGVAALGHLIQWCYVEKFSSDRLSLVQNTVAQALYSTAKGNQYESLLLRAPDIWDEVRWNWKAFIDGRVDEFFSQLQAVDEYVAKTVQAFSLQVSEMVKALSVTMLAAVAVLVSTFLAAHFRDDPDPKTLAIGVSVYLAYVVVFPLTFNMAQQLQSFFALLQQFKRRRERFEQQLPSYRVKEIVGVQVDQSVMWFVIWFVVILIAYLAVVLSLGWYFLPGLFG